MNCQSYHFTKSNHKRITLLGMSGIGKTYISKLLRDTREWFHYSGDYRIGTRYLDEAILDNIKKRMMYDDFLHHLLMSDAIYVNHNIAFDNLTPIASFLGKIGNPESGALPFDEFNRRQILHKNAETNAMLDVEKFIDKALHIYRYAHFVNDAGGSICELDQSSIATLAKHTLIIYLKTNASSEKLIIQRARKNPKPLYYEPTFLRTQLKEYLAKKCLTYIACIEPDDFARWVFVKLLYYRLPKYEKIAHQYGISIESEKLYQCQSADDFLTLINNALNAK